MPDSPSPLTPTPHQLSDRPSPPKQKSAGSCLEKLTYRQPPGWAPPAVGTQGNPKGSLPGKQRHTHCLRPPLFPTQLAPRTLAGMALPPGWRNPPGDPPARSGRASPRRLFSLHSPQLTPIWSVLGLVRPHSCPRADKQASRGISEKPPAPKGSPRQAKFRAFHIFTE